MKKILCVFILFAFALSGTGCTKSAPLPASFPTQENGENPSLSSAVSNPDRPFLDAKENPICYLGQGTPLGDGNNSGYYYLDQREDASYNIKYIDYASRTEIYLCSRPDCPHDDESCSAWRPYAGSAGCAIPIHENLYIMFYGTQSNADFERYGELAKMRIEKAALNGGDAQEIVSLSAAESLQGGVAADMQNLYMTIETVEKTEEDDTHRYRQIYAVDLQDGSISKSEPMEQADLHIVGASGRKLVVCYYEPQPKLSDTSIMYGTYDVDSGELSEWRIPLWGNPACVDEYLCYIDQAQRCLQKLNVLTGETISLPVNMDLSLYEDVRLSYAMKNYCIVLLYEPDQPVQEGLISLKTGEIFPLSIEMDAPEDAQNRIITLFAEIDDKTFLVAQAISFQPVLIPAGDGFISLPAPKYKLALLSIESCLANREDFIPIQSLKP